MVPDQVPATCMTDGADGELPPHDASASNAATMTPQTVSLCIGTFRLRVVGTIAEPIEIPIDEAFHRGKHFRPCVGEPLQLVAERTLATRRRGQIPIGDEPERHVV